MPQVLLQKLDGDVSKSFTVGEHILGRGSTLQCSSKKVSRNHGILNVTNNDGISLKSIHNNPCFYKTETSTNISMLTFGNTIKLKNNDKISLCLDHGWFLVIVKEESGPIEILNNERNFEVVASSEIAPTEINFEVAVSSEIAPTKINDEIVASQFSKRNMNDELENTTVKKYKLDEVETANGTNENLENIINIKSEPIDGEQSTSSNLNMSEIKQENSCEPTNKVNLNVKVEVKTEDVEVKKEADNDCDGKKDDGKIDKPSTSGISKRPWRDRCWYGSSCYRKNGNHKIEFKHPGDSDFDSDPEDSRPVCCYGAGCYRKNREHRKRYRHPGQTNVGTKPTPSRPKRNVVRPPRPMTQDSDEIDDYDYSDPFLNDGSEDEYEPSQDDTESDYEDSQEAEENTKWLMKEARKFFRANK